MSKKITKVKAPVEPDSGNSEDFLDVVMLGLAGNIKSAYRSAYRLHSDTEAGYLVMRDMVIAVIKVADNRLLMDIANLSMEELDRRINGKSTKPSCDTQSDI